MEEKKRINIGELSGKVLVFGGVYSNFQALEEMYEIAQSLEIPPGNVICTGDVVGYCAQPEESVQLIKKWGIHCIAGNVEIQLRSGEMDCGCNFNDGSRCDIFSRQWYPYAQSHLSEDSINWMQGLPDFIDFNYGELRVSVVHGDYDETAGYVFGSSPDVVVDKQLDKSNAQLVLAGHCGLPFSKTINNRYWFNAGVIGMPANDGTDDVWYGIMDEEDAAITLTHRSFIYDAIEASARMREGKLPAEYAKTLLTGIWDSNEILPSIETARQGIELLMDETELKIAKSKIGVKEDLSLRH